MTVPDGGPMARLKQVMEDPNTMSVIVQRLTDAEARESLPQIAKSWAVPLGKLFEWISEDRGRTEKYLNALRIASDTDIHETVQIADGVPRQAEGPDGKPLFDDAGKPVLVEPDAARDRLRIDARFKRAAKWDRPRFGDGQDVTVTVKDERTPLSREEALLEAARDVGFVLASADHVKRERELLPAPADVSDAEVVAPPGAEAPI